MTTTTETSRGRIDALGLAEQLVEEATSPAGVYYDVPTGYARIRAARLGIGRKEIGDALEKVKQERDLR
jgi:hypothetical protein